MMGRQHMIVSSAITVASICVCRASLFSPNLICQDVAITLVDYFYPHGLYHMWSFVWTICLFVAMLFGTLLPDIDSKNSMLGKYFYLPIEHRTWTHTMWVVILLFLLGRKWVICGAIGFGYLLHLIIDAVSVAGVCWFYPIQQYRRYPNGAFVAKNHKVKLYRAGERSETIAVIMMVAVCIVVCIMSL